MKRSDCTSRTIVIMAALMMIGIFAFFVPAGEGLSFTTDNDVVKDGRDQRKYDIASYGSGDDAEVYVVYEDYSVGSDPHVFFHRSLNAGETWQTPTDFMPIDPINLDKQISPAVDIHVDGTDVTIAVAFMDSTYRELPNLVDWVIAVKISIDHGATWSVNHLVTPITSVNYPNDKIKDPTIAFDPYGNLFVSWTGLEGQDRIDMAYSTDFGLTWSGIQQVPDHSMPQSSDYDHELSSLASDGQYVFVSWTDESEYRPMAWFAKAPASSLGGYPSLSFSVPQRVATEKPIDYDTYWPKFVADTNGVHLVWWDFVTDPGGGNNQDVYLDKPSVKYTRSNDHGATWSVGGKNDIIVNTSDPKGWHSAPDIDIGEDGTLAVTWMDYTLKKPNIFVTVSSDMGSTWSKPARANDHYPTIYREKPVVAVDSGGDAHAMWTYREDVDMDWDLKHSRSIVNIPPEPIDDLIFIVVDEELGMVGWTPNREPDFQMYKTYISEDKNFTISDEPGGPLYNESSNQLMNREVYNDQNDKNIDIEPDTTYYTKVVIEDQEGLTSVSNEVMFRTRPVNKAPVFVKEIPTLYMLEDEASEGALNLTHWREMGWIWDDVYNGYPALAYFVESEAEEPNVSANIRKVGIDPVVHFLDFFPLSTKQNWFGSEVFRIGVQDSGKDGGIGTPDDVIGYSNWFTLQVNSTNDVPIWLSFYDLNSDVNRPLQSTATELHLKIKESGALEDMEYRFSLKANDVDNDFLEYSASDDRVKIKVDGQDPQHKSIFTITPDNEDVPELNMTVTVSDRKGGERNITLYIPIENINGAPIFTDVDGEAILPTGGSVDFSIKEKGENSSVTFQIKAWDEDFGDVLTLKSMSSKPEIDKLGPRTWNVTVTAEEEDAISGSISFLLELLDRQKTDLSTLMVNIEVLNVPDPPEWVLNSGKVKVFFTYDENDENEWVNSKIEAEWDEPVEFEAYATDRDGDELTYTWIFINENSGEEFSADGKEITIRFYPSSGNLSNAKREKFLISLMVSDGNPLSEDISYYRELWLWPDDDNDNDGMPDKREIFFFGDLSQDPDDNWDLDGYTNVEEIGFGIPQFDPEKKVPYSMDRNQMDPTNKDVFPGQYTITGDDDDSQEEKGLPVFTIVIITIVALFLIAIAGGIVVVLRIQKKKDIEEDEDIEKRVKAMDERQKTLQGLYGVQKAGDIIGPDQSTLDDLTLDLGGQLYHEEGSGSLIKRTDEDEGEKKEVKSGPNWESGAGPVFESGAPGLEFGQSLEINDIDSDELSGKDIDEAALADTMGDLMDAADDFDEEALKDAGGNVMIGAVPMEEQIKQMQGGLRTQAGPRNPPPGQAPPPMQVPPGQAPPQMQAAPRQKGLPPAKPLKKPEEL